MNYPDMRWRCIGLAVSFGLLSAAAGCKSSSVAETRPASAPAKDATVVDHAPAPNPAQPIRPGFSLVLMTPEAIVSANFQADALGVWGRDAIDRCDAILRRESKPPRVLIQITFRTRGGPVFELSGHPRLSRDLEQTLRDALAQTTPLTAPFCNVCIRLQHVDESAKSPIEDAATFAPAARMTRDSTLATASPADIATDYAEVRAWAREVALPVLGGVARTVDPKFAGVRSMGKLLGETDLSQRLDVEALTFQNPDYWRGVMEMAPGNPLVTAMPVCLFVANGEFGKAARLLGYVNAFASEKPLGSVLLRMLDRRLASLRDKVASDIKAGIAQHDAGAYDKAAASYRRVLAAYPCSAWAQYELSFTTLFKQGPTVFMQKGAEQWVTDSPTILACDPMYDTQYSAKRGVNMNAMLDRMRLRALGEKKNLSQGERLGRHAEIAVRLGAYGYAAHIYWLSHPYSALKLKEEGFNEAKDKQLSELSATDVLCRYLYCLEKLGCPSLKSNFTPDFTAEFKTLDEALAKHRSE